MNEFSEKYLPVIVIAAVIYLVKIGAFTGIALLAGKLLRFLRGRE